MTDFETKLRQIITKRNGHLKPSQVEAQVQAAIAEAEQNALKFQLPVEDIEEEKIEDIEEEKKPTAKKAAKKSAKKTEKPKKAKVEEKPEEKGDDGDSSPSLFGKLFD